MRPATAEISPSSTGWAVSPWARPDPRPGEKRAHATLTVAPMPYAISAPSTCLGVSRHALTRRITPMVPHANRRASPIRGGKKSRVLGYGNENAW